MLPRRVECECGKVCGPGLTVDCAAVSCEGSECGEAEESAWVAIVVVPAGVTAVSMDT